VVATVLRLKLTLLGHSLRRDPWRLVVLVLGMLWALGMMPSLIGGAWWLAGPGRSVRADIIVMIGALMVLGWAFVPVLVFGTDDTLDPARFATFGVPLRRLVPALAVSSAVSVPAVFCAMVCAGTVIAWSGADRLVVGIAAVSAPICWITCLFTARVSILAATRTVASRRGRQAVAGMVGLAVVLAVIAARVAGALGLDGVLERVPALARVLGWSPLALPWAAPAAAEAGDLAGAGVRLVLAALWVAVLLAWWHRLLRRVLTRPTVRGGHARRRIDAILPNPDRAEPAPPTGHAASSGPAGSTRSPATGRYVAAAVARRARRYWATDPRFVAGIAAGLVLPVVITGLATMLAPSVAVLAGPLLGATLGWGRHNETAFDGSALWMHVVAGLPGRADRWGRVRGVLTWAVPVVVVGSATGVGFAGRWDLLPAALGTGLGLLAAGLAVSAVTSVVLPYPVPKAGTSPFEAEVGGVGATLVAQMAASAATTVVALPVLVGFALAWWWNPGAGWGTLLAGVLGGAVVLRAGVLIAGRALDTRWPRLLARLS
jgi:ABC-2 type transport system permease protein